MKEAAKARGEKRSAEVAERVRGVMAIIVQEMKANGGIYPHNGGAISMNEVARRAGIHYTTFHTQAQRELGKEVKTWIESLKKKEVVGRMRVRNGLATHLQEYRILYEGLEMSHHKTELDLQQAQAERDEALRKAESLMQENAQLKSLLEVATEGKVTHLQPRSK